MSKFFLDDSAPGAYVLYQTDTGRRRGRRTMELRLDEGQAAGIVKLLCHSLLGPEAAYDAKSEEILEGMSREDKMKVDLGLYVATTDVDILVDPGPNAPIEAVDAPPKKRGRKASPSVKKDNTNK